MDEIIYTKIVDECKMCQIHNDDPDCMNCKKVDICWKIVIGDF